MAVKPAFPLDFDRLAVYFQRSKRPFGTPGRIEEHTAPETAPNGRSNELLLDLRFVVLEEMSRTPPLDPPVRLTLRTELPSERVLDKELSSRREDKRYVHCMSSWRPRRDPAALLTVDSCVRI